MSWEVANRNLIVKAISELYYEEVISNEVREVGKGLYVLKLNNDISYSFKATESIWHHLIIDVNSLKRNDGLVLDAATFFKETQYLTQMDDIVLANFLEEMLHTLYSDQAILRKKESVEKLHQCDALEIESYLDGHPKLILNKGRLGWSPRDLSTFSPESNGEIRFHRIAVNKNIITVNCQRDSSFEAIVSADLTSQEIEGFRKAIYEENVDFESYYIIPVHPWQWENKISIFFQKDISERNIIFLSAAGDSYRSHISLRTFSNYNNRRLYDIKLSISILNTSCIRGIPSRYISIACEISEGIESILKQDETLLDSNTNCLKDIAACSYVESSYSDIKGAPYRYKEFLGAIWREPIAIKLEKDEKALMTGALSYLDDEGKSLIGLWIEKSLLSIEEWLEAYFKKVVIPLYHLQTQYGIGLVAHGQNTILKLKNNSPSGLIIKDFQGDLRLNENLPSETKKYFSDYVIERLDFLPANYIIHDLITGHFVSVLRFISQALFLSHSYKEEKFYSLLGDIVADYETRYPTKSKTPSLLTPSFHRVLLNKVRFEIGYQDSAQRPKPQLGTPLANPLINKSGSYG